MTLRCCLVLRHCQSEGGGKGLDSIIARVTLVYILIQIPSLLLDVVAIFHMNWVIIWGPPLLTAPIQCAGDTCQLGDLHIVLPSASRMAPIGYLILASPHNYSCLSNLSCGLLQCILFGTVLAKHLKAVTDPECKSSVSLGTILIYPYNTTVLF